MYDFGSADLDSHNRREASDEEEADMDGAVEGTGEEEAIAAQELLETLERENPATFQYLLEWRQVQEGQDAEFEARYVPQSAAL